MRSKLVRPNVAKDEQTSDLETRDPDDEARGSEPRRPRVRLGRVLLWVLLVVSVALACAAGAVYYIVQSLPERIAEKVKEKARERGFEIQFSSVRATAILPWEDGDPAVSLTGVTLTSNEVEDVSLDVESIRVPLTGTFPSFEPEHVYVDGVKLQTKSFATLIAFEKSAKSGSAAKTPADVTEVSIRIRSVSEGLPIAAVAEVERVELRPGSVEIDGVTVEIPVPFIDDLKLGPVSADIKRGDGKTTIKLDGLPYATVTIDDAGEVLGLDVSPVDDGVLEKLIPTDLPEMTVSGSLSAKIAGKNARSGSFSVLLDGYAPPVPKEAQGIVFGKKTKVKGNVRVDGLIVYLNDLEVEAGSFKMKGQGVANILKGTLEIRLKGSIPCSEMAVSAAGAHFGPEAAIFARALSSGHVGGNIAVAVNVDGKLSDIANVKIVPSASIGCRLSL